MASPSLQSLEPKSIAAGTALVEIAVTGTQLETSLVLVDGFVPRQTRTSPASVKVVLDASFVARPGKRVFVAHDTDTGGVSNELAFEVLKADGTRVSVNDNLPVHISALVSDVPFDPAPASNSLAGAFLLNIREHFRSALFNSSFRPDSVEINNLNVLFQPAVLEPLVINSREETTPLLSPPQRVQNGSALPDVVHFEVHQQYPIVHTWSIDAGLTDPPPPIGDFPTIEPSDPFAPAAKIDCSRVGEVREITVKVPIDRNEDITIPPRTTVDIGISIVTVPVNTAFEFGFTGQGDFHYVMRRGNTTARTIQPVPIGTMFRQYPVATVSVLSPTTARFACRGRYVGSIVKRVLTTKVEV
ncbi:MAG: hypothetical protein JNK48_20840 [Bryobacterales bacterium]|nr:hypothetical protein [Bryobacterales bacterium]